MLAQAFKSARDLQVLEVHRDAMIRLLGMLERKELVRLDHGVFSSRICSRRQYFNMAVWHDNAYSRLGSHCGTVGCIGGWVEVLSGEDFADKEGGFHLPRGPMRDLFYPPMSVHLMSNITVEQAASALRNYLTLGEARWQEILS